MKLLLIAPAIEEERSLNGAKIFTDTGMAYLCIVSKNETDKSLS